MEDQPAKTGGAPLATVDAIVDVLLGFDEAGRVPLATITARAMGVLGLSSEPTALARELMHGFGIADQSLAEQGVEAALKAAEWWLARAPAPLVIFQSGHAQIPQGIEADLRDLLRELAQAKKKSARKGCHVIAWRCDRSYERFKLLPLRDSADLPHAKDFQEKFFASNFAQAELKRLASLQRERPKASKSAIRIQDRLWQVAGDDARVSVNFEGQKVAAYGFPDRPPSAPPRLMRCSKCGEIYAPRDRQDVGRCPECGNAVRQAKHRQKVAKQPRGGDAMGALARSGAGFGGEWPSLADRAPALDDWDSDDGLRLMIEACERRGEKARAADLRAVLRKGVTP